MEFIFHFRKSFWMLSGLLANMAKSAKNVFKASHDLDLLDLVDNKNPYMAECQSAAWDDVVKALNEAKIFTKPLDKRAVQARVHTLVTSNRTDDLKKKVKSGTEEQYGQIKALVIRISAAIEDSQKAQDRKTKAAAAKTKEGDQASQAAMDEGEKGRSKRSLEDDSGVTSDEESEKQEFIKTTGGDDNDWEDEKEYRKVQKVKDAEEIATKSEPQSKKVRTSRLSKPSEMAVSDEKWISFFKEDAQRKYALKEAELKNAYDLEAKKLTSV